MDYRQAGVDIAAGEAFVKYIKPLAASTHRAGVLGTIGGFGGLFDLKAAGFVDPILVATTDGVGTKLKLAVATNRHGSIGIDLVAMCVNDLLAQGATPLCFLDYYATGLLEPTVSIQIMKGIVEGCLTAGCALLGGETAEMPGMYHGSDYDLAGFAIGAVQRDRVLPRSVTEGDVLIGIASSGFHSNGFSLIRKVLDASAHTWDDKADFAPGQRLADIFLTPTLIYADSLLPLLDLRQIQAIAHITGGGLPGNIGRIVPPGLKAVLNQVWPMSAEFHWLKALGNISDAEMLRTFNCGIGMVLIVNPQDVDSSLSLLSSYGEIVFRLGQLELGDGVEIRVNPF